MKLQKQLLALMIAVGATALLFQNCAGGYSPTTYSGGETSASVSPTPNPTFTQPAITNCTVNANTIWADSTGKIACSISMATTMAEGQTLTLSSNNGNTGSIQYFCSGGIATAVNGTNSCAQPAPAIVPPAITTQPTGMTITVGQPISLSVAASGSGLIYQWSKNGTAIGGANSAQYSIGVSALTDAGSYTVTIMNGANTVTSAAAVVIVNPIVHKWVLVGNYPTVEPAGFLYDPTCSIVSGTSTSDVRSAITYPTPLTGTTCTVLSAYCRDQLAVGGGVFSGNISISWNLLKCE